jgi:hypothetical protein
MYGLKLQNNKVIGQMSLARAYAKMEATVVVAVVRLVDNAIVKGKK